MCLCVLGGGGGWGGGLGGVNDVAVFYYCS